MSEPPVRDLKKKRKNARQLTVAAAAADETAEPTAPVMLATAPEAEEAMD